MDYAIYICDTETTGLDSRDNDIIEISFYRVSDNTQKTWCMKPFNTDNIDSGALRVNGHKLEDLLHQTNYGKLTYKDPKSTLIEIENWIMEDGSKTENRVLCGQNISFDKDMMIQSWKKAGSIDTFPFGRRMIDTMGIAFAMDYAKGTMEKGYSLSNLTKKYGIKNEKAHSAASDTISTFQVFVKQIEELEQALK